MCKIKKTVHFICDLNVNFLLKQFGVVQKRKPRYTNYKIKGTKIKKKYELKVLNNAPSTFPIIPPSTCPVKCEATCPVKCEATCPEKCFMFYYLTGSSILQF